MLERASCVFQSTAQFERKKENEKKAEKHNECFNDARCRPFIKDSTIHDRI